MQGKLSTVTPSYETKPVKICGIIDFIPNDWRGPIMNYLEYGIQPTDSENVRRLLLKVARYVIIDGELFKKSFLGPLLRCLGPSQAKITIQEIHDGSCGNHSRGLSLAHKIITQGYFWPYMSQEAEDYARKCERCQRHAPIARQPAEELHSVISPWSFLRWGMDIVGPFSPPLEDSGSYCWPQTISLNG